MPSFRKTPPREPPKRVRSALVPAAARISTTDSYANPKQLLRVDGTPVIIHLLKSCGRLCKRTVPLIRRSCRAPPPL